MRRAPAFIAVKSFKSAAASEINWWGGLPLAADAILTAITAGLNTEVAHAIAGREAEGGLVTAITKWLKDKNTQDAVKLIEHVAAERYVDQVSSLDQFQAVFKRLLKRFRIGGKTGEGPQRQLYIFVDDLDRCQPEEAVAALEAIKLFLDIQGCIFVLGMDRQVVEQGINVRYAAFREAGFDARAYLDKIIQVPFNLPPLGSAQISRYLRELSGEIGEGAFAICGDLIRSAAPSNPRTLKRILNALLLTLYLDGNNAASLKELAEGRGDVDRLRRLAKLVLLQVSFGDTWRAILAGLSLKDAEKFVLGSEAQLPEETKKLLRGPFLEALFKAQPRFSTLNDEEIARMLTLSKITSTD